MVNASIIEAMAAPKTARIGGWYHTRPLTLNIVKSVTYFGFEKWMML